MSTRWGQPREGVQCYELFGGIALKIHTFSFSSTATATLVAALFFQELTTATHCCLVILVMLHPNCNGNRTMQLE